MGTGGSRYGAGRPASHLKAEYCKQLDIRRWQREGVLKAGRAGSWRWTSRETGEQTGAIGYRAEDDCIRLDYSIDGKPSGQTVRLNHSACTYGGTRPWFICPIRGEPVAILYLRAGRFACRRCQRLAYASQSEDTLGRMWRKQSKAEAKLGENWQRPKGMHKATRERLLSIIWQCEEWRDEALAGHLATVMTRYRTLSLG
jgi:hypothetical protein